MYVLVRSYEEQVKSKNAFGCVETQQIFGVGHE
jgi:hypothetical protein